MRSWLRKFGTRTMPHLAKTSGASATLLTVTKSWNAAWSRGSGMSEAFTGAAPAGAAPVKASDIPLPLDQAAFHDLVTVSSVAEAPEVFARWGIVRVPNFLSQDEVTTLLEAAKRHGVRRTAFAQDSQADRYTLWIDGDGMTAEQTA